VPADSVERLRRHSENPVILFSHSHSFWLPGHPVQHVLVAMYCIHKTASLLSSALTYLLLLCLTGWTLYFTFHLTQQKLTHTNLDNLPFFIRNKHYMSTMFLLKVFGTVTIVLCLPAGLLASTKDLSKEYGDKCDRAWGDVLLGGSGPTFFCLRLLRLIRLCRHLRAGLRDCVLLVRLVATYRGRRLQDQSRAQVHQLDRHRRRAAVVHFQQHLQNGRVIVLSWC
jgi:hypothetical protein